MGKEEIKNLANVYTVLLKAVYTPSFSIPMGGKNTSCLSRILEAMEKDFGSITGERMVDFCVSAAYANREHLSKDIARVFGPAAWNRYKNEKHQSDWYQDKWLAQNNIDRVNLYELIKDRSEHPMQKYLYMESEEYTKKRLINSNAGFYLCQVQTLGWSPVSECCNMCVNVEKCKEKTNNKYPELYRLRCEYAEKYRK